MNDQIIQSTGVALGYNKVLRQTYLLLALSMIPTVAGASLGIFFQFSFMAGSPFIGFILIMAIAFGFFYAIEKNKNNSLGVGLLLGFTFFMGLMLSQILQFALGFRNGVEMIALAGGGTAAIFFVMAAIGNNPARDFSSWGRFLFVGVIVALVAIVANIFLKMPALSLAISCGVLFIFSAYIMYDINRIVRGGERNYITAALAVYLDIYNVFVSLLQLIMAFTGERE